MSLSAAFACRRPSVLLCIVLYLSFFVVADIGCGSGWGGSKGWYSGGDVVTLVVGLLLISPTWIISTINEGMKKTVTAGNELCVPFCLLIQFIELVYCSHLLTLILCFMRHSGDASCAVPFVKEPTRNDQLYIP